SFRVETLNLGRFGHSTVLVDNKLYFFGGSLGPCTNDVFYLDLSQQFNAENPPWTDLTSNSGIGFKIMRNQNNEDSFISLVYEFNLKSGQWIIPVIKGNVPARRREFQAVADDLGSIYVFGGGADKSIGSNITQIFNDMAILNTVNLTWSYGPIVNAPTPRVDYTATLLSDGVIVYIGGREYIYGVFAVVDAMTIDLELL
ncbi:9876_t:CDS:2, partial [Funneliformis geosporum]